ncbi:proton-conducting transporter transmembrane domain-containing protein [Thermogladius sp. 4427co]|uniref:proton-conducting transporter transmembrane domain-containing protein n=1 Tax=Thermogladius sp. 4427co TaxID=3450718 RepID=UPI003F79053D
MLGVEVPIIALALSILALLASVRRKSLVNIVLKTLSMILFTTASLILCNTGVVDRFSTVLSTLSYAIGLVIVFFGENYSVLEKYPTSLTYFTALFSALISLTYLSPNLITFISVWSLMEIAGFILVRLGEEYSTEGSLRASRGYILVSTASFELTAFVLIVAAIPVIAGFSPEILFRPFNISTGRLLVESPIVVSLLTIGFIAKAALFPLHFWLPGAHSSAPSPGSALLSGLSTPLGFYGLYRLLNIVELGLPATYFATALVLMGLASILYAGLQAVGQRDGKIMLAYSTIMTNGFISVVFADYILHPLNQFLEMLLILSIAMQMCYKTALFTDIGLIEASLGTRYIHGLSNLSEKLRISGIGASISASTLLGLPGTIGFVVKLLSLYYIVLELISNVSLTGVLAAVSIVSYIALSMLIGLRYLTIYIPSARAKPTFLEFKNPGLALQASVLLLGLLNLVAPSMIIAELPDPSWILYLAILLLPLPLLVFTPLYVSKWGGAPG